MIVRAWFEEDSSESFTKLTLSLEHWRVQEEDGKETFSLMPSRLKVVSCSQNTLTEELQIYACNHFFPVQFLWASRFVHFCSLPFDFHIPGNPPKTVFSSTHNSLSQKIYTVLHDCSHDLSQTEAACIYQLC